MSAPAFFFPRTVAEAADVLDAYDGAAKLVAGGTALTLMVAQRLVSPQALVSLRDVPGLGEVRIDSGGDSEDAGVLRIGALVTHAAAARHPLVRRHAPLLADSLAVVGNAQVRSAATVGGVLAEADYASDPPATLRALDARVTAHGPAGERTIGVGELLLGFYQTSLASAEIVTEVRVPVLPAGTGSAYLKYTSRSHEDRPCVGVAAIVRCADDGTCADLRIAVGAACDAPLRLGAVEQQARGRQLDDATLTELADTYADRIDPVSDVRGSAWYRREMVRVWVRRAVERARLRTRAHEHSKERAQ
ncbi:FAD binding domain-containing protein [Pseudonocardia sp. H11422]|uniref:FAD binding domain-containing protein n=1 Tax=Pseudonocardia sp. H11422 TaxID=2835866 RepID=UPI001BDC00E4|nr:xanthine dehydrogenase family protein subunit M [Pseudonocardia sp. H11422]